MLLIREKIHVDFDKDVTDLVKFVLWVSLEKEVLFKRKGNNIEEGLGEEEGITWWTCKGIIEFKIKIVHFYEKSFLDF